MQSNGTAGTNVLLPSIFLGKDSIITATTTRSYLGSALKYWRQSRQWKRQSSIKPARRKFTRWRESFSAGRSPLIDCEPWITFAARDFLEANLTESSRVFEWGSGGSTLFLLQRAAEVWTVEHDEEWFRNVQKSVAAQGYHQWKGQLILPSAKETDQSLVSNPADWTHYYSGCNTLQNRSMRDYVNSIEQHDDASFDIIMVDGRARPSCLFHAWRKLKPNGLLFLDNAEVDYYGPIGELLTQHSEEYLAFAGAGPYVSSFWLTCAWRRPNTLAELPSEFSYTSREEIYE